MADNWKNLIYKLEKIEIGEAIARGKDGQENVNKSPKIVVPYVNNYTEDFSLMVLAMGSQEERK